MAQFLPIRRQPRALPAISWRSRLGLYSVNFLLAELVGVLIPLLGDYLLESGWSFAGIGVATAMAGMGLLLSQCPVGALLDRISQPRATLMAASLVVGGCFASMPLCRDNPPLLFALLFVSGVGQAFILPMLAALALWLGGRSGVNRLMGQSQSCNHAGNIVASFALMQLVRRLGKASAFYAVGGISVAAALSCFLLRPQEMRSHAAQSAPQASWATLLRDRRVRQLMLCSICFNVANAAVTPLVALYARTLAAASGFVTEMVFVAQASMVLAAVAAGRLGDVWGRRPMMAVAFATLPLRIALYIVVESPELFLAVALLDGLAVGTYTVILASMCADIDAGRGRFNTLMGLMFATLALGGAISPLAGGVLVQHYGFQTTFAVFASIAALGWVLLMATMPETLPAAADTMADVQPLRRGPLSAHEQGDVAPHTGAPKKGSAADEHAPAQR